MTWQRSSRAQDLAGLAISEGIEGISRGPSHVRLFLEGKDFWEVTFPRCRIGEIGEIDPGTVDVEVGFHVHVEQGWIRENQRRAILLEAERLIGSEYDVMELWEHLLHEAGIDDEDHSDPGRFVCSSGVEHVFRTAGLGFRPNHPLVSPEDLRESPLYGVRRQWGKSPREAA